PAAPSQARTLPLLALPQGQNAAPGPPDGQTWRPSADLHDACDRCAAGAFGARSKQCGDCGNAEERRIAIFVASHQIVPYLAWFRSSLGKLIKRAANRDGGNRAFTLVLPPFVDLGGDLYHSASFLQHPLLVAPGVVVFDEGKSRYLLGRFFLYWRCF